MISHLLETVTAMKPLYFCLFPLFSQSLSMPTIDNKCSQCFFYDIMLFSFQLVRFVNMDWIQERVKTRRFVCGP